VWYRKAIASQGTFPEAEMAIGDIYRLEGESDLAIREYEKAYNLRNAFYNSESKYEILYKLASILQEQRLYRQMEARLIEICNDDASYNVPQGSRLKERVVKTFFEKDINGVFKIYRFNANFAAAAHSRLGWFYYKTGRFDLSIEHLLYALIIKMTRVVQFVLQDDPEYQFATLDGLIKRTRTNPSLQGYLVDSDVAADLYYLAGSVFQNGNPQHAQSLWQLLVGWGGIAGRYADLSRKQIRSPWLEPYLQLPGKPLRD
jgi:tetratricopeptide (TPR) repeat protein